MVKTLDANQLQKIDRPRIQPIYFCHLLLSGITLYWSDRCFTYNGHNYEDYISSLSDIETEIRNLGGGNNTQVTFIFKNEPIQAYGTLIEFFDAYPPEKCYIEVYKLLVDTGETFGSDVSTKIYKGELGQSYEIVDPPLDFRIDASSMLFGKNASLPLNVLKEQDFPDIDPDDIGKCRNKIFGSVNKVICPWTVAGWASTICSEIDSDDTTVYISEYDRAPAATFSMMIELEKVSVTVKVGAQFTISRAQGGTTATNHSKGSICYEVRTDFEVEVAEHPVKSIGEIFVSRGGVWMRVVSGATKYANSGGRAKIVFDDKVTFGSLIEISAETTPDEGSHYHAIPAQGFSSKQCVPDGSSGADGHANVIDGNTDSYCGIDPDEGVQARFDGEANLGAISKVQIWIYKNDTAATGYVQSPNGTNLQTLPAGTTPGWYRVIKTSGASWTDSVVVIGGAGGNQIGEIYKIVEYTPAADEVDNHAATGIDVEVLLSGNSAANVTIGNSVACDVEGFEDDGSGTYTGTPNALIERPDHVRKYILMALLGFSSSDIGSSFATIGAIYESRAGGYKFGFVLHLVATETMELFRQMDLQSASNMFESGGKFQLAFGPSISPTSQITINKDNVEGLIIFGKTDIADLRNKIIAHYNRDYTKSGNLGEMYRGLKEKTTGSGDLTLEIELSCITDQVLMVSDVVGWILSERQLRKTIKLLADWSAMKIESCDYFTVQSTFWSGTIFKCLIYGERTKGQRVPMNGLEYVAYAPESDGNYIFIADAFNYRIQKRSKVDALTYSAKLGSQGSGINQFNIPLGMACDETWLFVTDSQNARVHKRLKEDLLYSDDVGTSGSGNGQFNTPIGICCDDTYIYVIDSSNSRVQIFKKSDLSFVDTFGQYGSGTGDFGYPKGIAVDANYLYITDGGYGHHWLIKRNKTSPYAFVSRQGETYGYSGSGDGEFDTPYQVCVDDTHVFVADLGNSRIQKFLKSDLSFVSKIGSYGSGNDQFNGLNGITCDDTHLFVSDTGNDRIVKRLKSDLSYISKIGSAGSGDDQFNDPCMIAIYYWPF